MRPSSYVIGIVLSGVAIMMAIVALTHLLPGRFNPSALQPSSEKAGQLRPSADPLIFGGPLQRNLEGVTPQVFLEERTGRTVPQFEKKDFTVRAGEVISLTFRNRSTVGHRHDWVLVKPGKAQTVDNLARSAGPERLWIPDSADILAYVLLTEPGSSRIIVFRAPAETGDYPFLCTFPGHGAVMNGILHVEK